MAASIISTEVLTGNSPQDLTIPSGTDAVFVFWGYFSTFGSSVRLYDATLGGTAFDDSVEALGSSTLTAGGVFAWHGIGTGTKSLAWSKTTPSSARGPILTAVYMSAAGAWNDADADNSVAGAAISFSLDSDTDDVVVKCDTQISAIPSLSSGWSSLATTTYGTFYQRVSDADSPGDPSTTVNAEDENYSSLVGISVPEIQYPVEAEVGLNSDVDGYVETGVFNYGIGFNSEVDAESIYYFLNDYAGFNDAIDTSGNTQNPVVSDGLGLSGISDAYLATETLYKTLGLRSTSDAVYETKHAENEIGLNAATDGNLEFPRITEDEIGLNAFVDAYNYSQWAAENLIKAKKLFILTLTGAADGTTDVEIPFSSWQARKRSGSQSYVSAVIPKYSYSAQIVARQNGEMVIEAVYYVDGAESLRQEIIRAPIQTIRTYEGAYSRSITVEGYKTVTYYGKSVTLQNQTYRSLNAGSFEFRFADIDLFLAPADELTVGDDTFTVGEIAYYASSVQRQMYVKQVS